MNRRYIVNVEAPKRVDGSIELAAVHEPPAGAPWRLWYRVPEAWAGALTELGDPFAVGSVQTAMLHGVDLEIRGTVSRSLLAGLEDYIEVWNCWDGEHYARIGLGATREADAEAGAGADAVCSFSGGVDASFTVLRHVRGLAGRRSKKIGAAILVHGFDIPLDDTAGFDGAFARAAETLRQYDIPLAPVATNYRENGLDWFWAFGPATIACLHLFQRRFRTGLIAGAENYAYPKPTSAHPLIDHMLGNSSFAVIHDGAGFTRSQKIAALAGEPPMLRGLRVCWEGAHRDRNCGRCEKCIRTILNFRAMGIPRPEAFPAGVALEQIRRLPIRNAAVLNEYRTIVSEAVRHGLGRERWVSVLNRRIATVNRQLAAPPWVMALKSTAVWQGLRQLRNRMRRPLS